VKPEVTATDETWFDVEQTHNSQNDRDWSEEPLPLEKRIVSRQQKPKQVMVWAGVTHDGKTPLFFVPDCVKVKGPEYREMLSKKVLPWAKKHFGNRHWTFMQDGAPAHKAEETQDWIRENFPDFIEVDISPKRSNGMWPPNSPDLNVMDYSIWSILESNACSKPHQSIEALKKSLVKVWNELPMETIAKAVDAFPKRLKMCAEAGGGHFEHK
jgi:hypothetical protein